MMHQLLYTSQAVEHVSREDCFDILAEARTKNARNGITGLLVYASKGTFIQVLEGASAAVQQTFERIKCDVRHREVTLLYESESANRTFADWSMGYYETADASLAAQQPSAILSAMDAIYRANS